MPVQACYATLHNGGVAFYDVAIAIPATPIPFAPAGVMTGSPSDVDFTAYQTITRNAGSFVTDGFAVGQVVAISGTTLNNAFTGVIVDVLPFQLRFASGIVVESNVNAPTITANFTRAFRLGERVTAAMFTSATLATLVAGGSLVPVEGRETDPPADTSNVKLAASGRALRAVVASGSPIELRAVDGRTVRSYTTGQTVLSRDIAKGSWEQAISRGTITLAPSYLTRNAFYVNASNQAVKYKWLGGANGVTARNCSPPCTRPWGRFSGNWQPNGGALVIPDEELWGTAEGGLSVDFAVNEEFWSDSVCREWFDLFALNGDGARAGFVEIV